MSQEKVNRYKEQKANRKAIMKKEKRMKIFRNTVTAVVVVAVLSWVGYSGYNSYVDSQPVEKTEVDYTSIAEYLTGLAE
ncbi:hypothetical protein HMPREF9477_00098 [Lachnospiraceae bacterium 2_1_46FAA]|jgi:cell division protein FtsB|nr:hypothetical protein HMPREF9477_00098 [Lachnospiraceae bacterium 2_1_46FAA]